RPGGRDPAERRGMGTAGGRRGVGVRRGRARSRGGSRGVDGLRRPGADRRRARRGGRRGGGGASTTAPGGRRGAVVAMIRPYVTLSCAMSLDGYLDTASPHKLAMSNSDDFDRVDQLRAESDAIMVGASTVRRDNPRLLIRSAARRREREQAGLTSSPIKVTVTATGDLSADAAFFAEGDVEKIVYGTQEVARTLEDALGGVASVVALGPDASMADVLDDLAERGVERLMVEGGGRVLTQFL